MCACGVAVTVLMLYIIFMWKIGAAQNYKSLLLLLLIINHHLMTWGVERERERERERQRQRQTERQRQSTTKQI